VVGPDVSRRRKSTGGGAAPAQGPDKIASSTRSCSKRCATLSPARKTRRTRGDGPSADQIRCGLRPELRAEQVAVTEFINLANSLSDSPAATDIP
jgi:hypothetical protein